MKESIIIAGEVYYLAFVVAFGIAVLIKLLHAVIHRISSRKAKEIPVE